MQPIPRPELLDPDRITSNDRDDMTLLEHRSRAQELDDALHATCDYATELWQHLDAARAYLYDSLPSDPRAPGTDPHRGASPTGPDDEEGWQRWIDTVATVTSILAGPHGDSGYALHEARRTARDRREAPNLAVLEKTHAHTGDPAAGADTPTDAAPPAAERSAERPDGGKPWRAVAVGLLGVLALRELRPRRPGTGAQPRTSSP